MFDRIDNSLSAEIKADGEVRVVKVTSSGQVLDAQRVNRMLDELSAQRTANIVLDLGELDAIWAITLAVLVAAYGMDRDDPPPLAVVVPQPGVFEALCQRGLARFVALYQSVEDARILIASGLARPTRRQMRTKRPAKFARVARSQAPADARGRRHPRGG